MTCGRETLLVSGPGGAPNTPLVSVQSDSVDRALPVRHEEVVLLFDVDVELDTAADQLVLAESRIGDHLIAGAQTGEFDPLIRPLYAPRCVRGRDPIHMDKLPTDVVTQSRLWSMDTAVFAIDRPRAHCVPWAVQS